jgi:hypothetical protein
MRLNWFEIGWAERVSRICSVLLISATTLAWSLIPAESHEYIFDIVKRNPRILPAWGWIVPPTYSKEKWVKQLDGTTGPVDRVIVRGKPFYLGSVCKPHECGWNYIVFLISVDGSEVYGMLRSETLNVKGDFFGVPDEDAKRVISKYMADLFSD